MATDIKSMFDTLDKLLASTDLTNVTSESSGFEELKDGYYLCEVEKAELKTSSKGSPMASFKFKVVEDGFDVVVDDKGSVTLNEITKSKNKHLYVNFVLTDESSVKRFVNNMLKFEDDEGESLLPKEAFTTSDTLEGAIEALAGSCIYIQVSTTIKDDGSKSTWNNLISWKRAAALELPM